nr:N-acetyltransferase [Streptococcus sp. S784/96/1]
MVMTVGIKPVAKEEVPILQELAMKTFRETFEDNYTEEQLQTFFANQYDKAVLSAELDHSETEIDFLMVNNEPVGYLKVNWGNAQTERKLDDAFEIQRIYILKAYQGQGFGKMLLDYALEVAQDMDKSWVWLGVWEHNTQAQGFYAKYGFEKFSEHQFIISENQVDVDWLLRKKLK